MKPLMMICLAIFLSGQAFAKPPTLTEEKVSKIAVLIFEGGGYSEYKAGFDCTKPRYDGKSGEWSIEAVPPFASGVVHAPAYFFNIRDSDGFYRIGRLEYSRGFVPKSSEHFKMSPGLKRRIQQIMQN